MGTRASGPHREPAVGTTLFPGSDRDTFGQSRKAERLAPTGAPWMGCCHHSSSCVIKSQHQRHRMGDPTDSWSNAHPFSLLQPHPWDLGRGRAMLGSTNSC